MLSQLGRQSPLPAFSGTQGVQSINDSQRLVHQTTILSNNEDSRNSRIADTRSNQKSSKSRGYFTRTPIQNEANRGWGFQVDELQLGQTQQQFVKDQPTQQHNELKLGTMTTLKLRKDDHHCQRITFYLLVTLASYHATMFKAKRRLFASKLLFILLFEDYEQNRSLRTSVWSLKHAITCVCFSFNCSHWYL